MGLRKLLRRPRKQTLGDNIDKPTQQQSSLMALPGEIRNEIYSLVLTCDERIAISSKPFPEPALLRTCQDIRKEAASIFYNENNFSIDCPNWEYTIYKQYFERLRRYAGEHHDVKTIWVNTGSWTCRANLVEFLRAVHEGEVRPGFKYPGNRSKTGWIAGAFEIVHRMEAQDWETVSKVLEVYLNQMDMANNRWNWN